MKLSYLSLILVLSCACGQPGQEMYPDIADAARTSFCVASDDTALVKIFDWAVSNSNRYVGEIPIRSDLGTKRLCRIARLSACGMSLINV